CRELLAFGSLYGARPVCRVSGVQATVSRGIIFLFCFYCYRALRDLHSFPTRRSSDLFFVTLPTFSLLGILEPEAMPAAFFNNTEDRKSTRLNSSHVSISYAVFCLKKKSNIARHHWPGQPPRRNRHTASALDKAHSSMF